jgi:hypothetical protein
VNLDKNCKGSEIVFAILETCVVSILKASSSNQVSEIGLVARGKLSPDLIGKVRG